MYRILGGDGKEYGPISADSARQWIAEGRLGPQSQVRAEGTTEWKTLADFPELTSAMRPAGGAPPPPRPTSTGTVTPKTSGLAIASVILGALGCLGITAVAGLVCGIVALGRINKSYGRQKGRGLAITGISLSAVMLLLALPAVFMSAMLLPALSKAKGKAQSISCVNNMKQIGLALRIYSADHKETFPPDFLSMSNELGSPVILVCPMDRTRSRPASHDWSAMSASQISYEFLTPNAAESNVTSQVVIRCPIHGHTGLGDGSVHQGRWK